MSAIWRADTVAILADGGGSSVVVKSNVPDFEDGFSRIRNEDREWSGTVLIFTAKKSGSRSGIHGSDGVVSEATHNIYFPYTSTVSVGYRIYESGSEDYYEILKIGLFEDHKEIEAKKVENR